MPFIADTFCLKPKWDGIPRDDLGNIIIHSSFHQVKYQNIIYLLYWAGCAELLAQHNWSAVVSLLTSKYSIPTLPIGNDNSPDDLINKLPGIEYIGFFK